MNDVVLLNVHGGFPSSMIRRAVLELPNLKSLTEHASFHDRVYPTNACAGPALHDTIMDAPLGSMVDGVWHEWAYTRRATRSLFHVFQRAQYATRVYGAFGLDARLDPHAHMHVRPSDFDHSLESYGVDVCDAQDAAFTCQLGIAHDRDTFDRVAAHLADGSRGNQLTMVNLLGCQDAHKCSFRDIDPETVAIPVMNFETKDAYDERMFAETVTVDDPRSDESASARIDPLRRSAQLKDWLQGANGDCSRAALVRTITGLHRFCWKCLQQLDEGVGLVVEALRRANRLENAIIYVYSDHAISLYEHGELCEAPWDACLRSFLIRRVPRSPRSSQTAPLSLANFATMLLDDCGIVADWHMAPALPNACVTVGIALSWLARASMDPIVSVFNLRTFFVRTAIYHHDRLYSVVQWFGLQDLIDAAGADDFADPESKAKSMHKRSQWPNPVSDASFDELRRKRALQIYDLHADPEERWNLAEDQRWVGSGLASQLEGVIQQAMAHHKLQSFTLVIPPDVHRLSPEHVTFCSVQLHNRIRARVRKTISPPRRRVVHTSTQTSPHKSTMMHLESGAAVELSAAPPSLAPSLAPSMGSSQSDDGSSVASSQPVNVARPSKGVRSSRSALAAGHTRGAIRAREMAKRPG